MTFILFEKPWMEKLRFSFLNLTTMSEFIQGNFSVNIQLFRAINFACVWLSICIKLTPNKSAQSFWPSQPDHEIPCQSILPTRAASGFFPHTSSSASSSTQFPFPSSLRHLEMTLGLICLIRHRDSVKGGFSGILVGSRNYHIRTPHECFLLFQYSTQNKIHKMVYPLNSVK